MPDCSRATSNRPSTIRMSRRDSLWMMFAAGVIAAPVASPSPIACAKPWMEVSGVRSSCEMSARNACSLPRARSISCAMSLKALPSSATSLGPATGTRARYSPRANRRATATRSRSGRVIVRDRRPATMRPAVRMTIRTSRGATPTSAIPRPDEKPRLSALART